MLGKFLAVTAAKAIAQNITKGAVNVSLNLGGLGRAKNSDAGDVPEVCPGICADDFVDMDYREVINILIANGFTNIGVKELRDLRNNRFDRDNYGLVQRVAINGNDSFDDDDRFPTTAYVLVEFHLFTDSPSPKIPEFEKLERRKRAMAPELEEPVICEYCDCVVEKGLTVCSHCGAPVERNK